MINFPPNLNLPIPPSLSPFLSLQSLPPSVPPSGTLPLSHRGVDTGASFCAPASYLVSVTQLGRQPCVCRPLSPPLFSCAQPEQPTACDGNARRQQRPPAAGKAPGCPLGACGPVNWVACALDNGGAAERRGRPASREPRRPDSDQSRLTDSDRSRLTDSDRSRLTDSDQSCLTDSDQSRLARALTDAPAAEGSRLRHCRAFGEAYWMVCVVSAPVWVAGGGGGGVMGPCMPQPRPRLAGFSSH